MRTLQLFLAIFLLVVVTPLAIGADKPSFVVRDADGTVVGPVLEQTIDLAVARGLTSPLWVARKTPNSWIFVPLTENAVWDTKNLTPFLYEGAFCSGQPLLPAPRAADEVQASVIFGSDVYVSAEPGSDRIIRSLGVRMMNTAACQEQLLDGNLCCTTLKQDETYFVGEAISFPITHLSLRPPFHLEQTTSAPPIAIK